MLFETFSSLLLFRSPLGDWKFNFLVNMCRGVGTGETGEARASPEIRGCLKSNRKEKKYVGYSFFRVLHLKLHCSSTPLNV